MLQVNTLVRTAMSQTQPRSSTIALLRAKSSVAQQLIHFTWTKPWPDLEDARDDNSLYLFSEFSESVLCV